MSTATATGVARFIGSAKGAVCDGDQAVAWTGEASLFHLVPALNGFDAVVVSTAFGVPRVRFNGTVERGFETLTFGVRGDQIDWMDLPGGGFNTTVGEALAEAGYTLA